jgi:hypothetical protein
MKIAKSHVSLNALCKCATIVIVGLTSAPWANAANSTISASATIVPPLAVSEPSDIRFSTFIAGPTPGTLTLFVPPALPSVAPTSATPIKNGGGSPAGGVQIVRGTNCARMRNCGLGALQIGGPASSSFSGVSIQPSATLTSGDNTLTLEGIRLRYGASGTAGTISGPGIVSPAGNGTIVIGGALTVAASQALGTYTGSLTVLVDY